MTGFLWLCSYCDDMFLVSFRLEIFNKLDQTRSLPAFTTTSRRPPIIFSLKNIFNDILRTQFPAFFIRQHIYCKDAKMLFWVEECAILHGTFYGPCKADFFPQKKTGMVLIRIKADWDCSQMRQPKVLVQSYSTTSQFPFHKKNSQPYIKCAYQYIE